MIQKIYNERALIAKFVAVGACGFVVNYLVLAICTNSFGINKVVSEVIAAAVALQVTFFFNDRWTYRLEHTKATLALSIQARYATYIATNSFGSLMTVIMFAIFSSFLDKLIALGLSAIAAMVWNYSMNRIFIWRQSFTSTNL